MYILSTEAYNVMPCVHLDSFHTSSVCTICTGVRSVELNQGILSFGTGDGNVYFHDVRFSNNQLSNFRDDMCLLKTSEGYLVSLLLHYNVPSSVIQLQTTHIFCTET